MNKIRVYSKRKALVCTLLFIASVTHAQPERTGKVFKKQLYMIAKFRYDSKSNDTCDYIKFKSGNVKRFNCPGSKQSIVFKKGKMVLDKEKFSVDTIESYTDYRWYCIINNGMPLMLLKKGKISLYGYSDGATEVFKDEERGAGFLVMRYYYSMYVQVENGAITELTPEKLANLTSDNPDCQDLINRYLRNTEKTRFIEQAIDVYNGVIHGEEDYFEARGLQGKYRGN